MGLFEQFPYTNFHELNLDWVIREIKKLKRKIELWPGKYYNMPVIAGVAYFPIQKKQPKKQYTILEFFVQDSATKYHYQDGDYNFINLRGEPITAVPGQLYVGYIDKNNNLKTFEFPDPLDADTLQGHNANYFAKVSDLQNFASIDMLNSYASKTYVSEQLSTYATKAFVESELTDYETSDNIDTTFSNYFQPYGTLASPYTNCVRQTLTAVSPVAGSCVVAQYKYYVTINTTIRGEISPDSLTKYYSPSGTLVMLCSRSGNDFHLPNSNCSTNSDTPAQVKNCYFAPAWNFRTNTPDTGYIFYDNTNNRTVYAIKETCFNANGNTNLSHATPAIQYQASVTNF